MTDNPMRPGAELTGSGPFETERQVAALPAVRAIHDAMRASSRRGVMAEESYLMLFRACEAAGVDLGRPSSYDRQILAWLAGFTPEACAVVAALIARAALGSVPAVSGPISVRPDEIPDSEIEHPSVTAARQLLGVPVIALPADEGELTSVIVEYRDAMRELVAFFDTMPWIPDPTGTERERLAAELLAEVPAAGRTPVPSDSDGGAATARVLASLPGLAATVTHWLQEARRESAGPLTGIRTVLAGFDRQYALEAVDRIVGEASQPPDVLRQALADAITYREASATDHACADCDEDWRGLCEDHAADLDRKDSYVALARDLGIEVDQ